jgi:MraZ protein
MQCSGSYECSIDAKKRLSIPFAVQKCINPKEDGDSFYIVPGRRPGTLALYPNQYYDRIRPNPGTGDSLSDEVYEFWQFECSQTVQAGTDAQGRILIPQRLLDKAGVGKQVVLMGVNDHLELWAREDYEKFVEARWADYGQRRAAAMRELAEVSAARKAESASAKEDAGVKSTE